MFNQVFVRIKLLSSFLLFLSTGFCQSNIYFGQENLVYPQEAGIYETLEDFMNDSVKYIGVYNEAFDKLKIGVQRQKYLGTVNFGKTYYSYKDATFFGYKDDCGNRHRIVNGGNYTVLSAGAIWLYSISYRNNIYSNEYMPGENFRTKKEGKKIQKYATDKEPWAWYSLGPDTEIIRLKKWGKKPNEKVGQALFSSDMEIYNQFIADKKEDYSLLFSNSYINNMERVVYYVEAYNRKHSE